MIVKVRKTENLKVKTVKSAWGETLYKIDGQFMTINQAAIYNINKENQKGK
jgi:hypothetical protein